MQFGGGVIRAFPADVRLGHHPFDHPLSSLMHKYILIHITGSVVATDYFEYYTP
jgi:hypothetical protein